MSEHTTQIRLAPRGRRLVDPWSAGALLIAAAVMIPILAVIWFALTPTENIWPHLLRTTLPRYLANTVVLALSVGVLTAMIGAGRLGWWSCIAFPGIACCNGRC